MPCVIKLIKTHHLPLDLCVVVIIHVSVAFGADMNNDNNRQIQR